MTAGPESEPRERKSREQKRGEAEQRNRRYRGTRDARRRFEAVESELEGLTARHEELLGLLADPGLYADKERFAAAMAGYAETKQRIETLEAEWVLLAEQIERTEAGDGSA